QLIAIRQPNYPATVEHRHVELRQWGLQRAHQRRQRTWRFVNQLQRYIGGTSWQRQVERLAGALCGGPARGLLGHERTAPPRIGRQRDLQLLPAGGLYVVSSLVQRDVRQHVTRFQPQTPSPGVQVAGTLARRGGELRLRAGEFIGRIAIGG